jgi:VWFA-related protein
MKPTAISFFLALALAISSSAHSQDRQTATVNFSVLSKNTWGFIEGLKATDVSIEEDGDAREVIRLDSGEQTLSVIVLIDVSGSMRAYLELIKDVAMETIKPLKPEDEVALIIFNNEAELVRDFTKDKKLLGDEIKKLSQRQVRAQTFLNKAVFLAAEHLQKSSNANNRRLIILITDDRIGKSSNEDKIPPRDEVRKELIESRAVVSGLITPEPKVRSPFLIDNRSKGPVSRYVEDTGGLVLPVEDKNARTKINKMIDGFHKQYTLEYRQASARRDNRSPKIRVKVSKELERREGELIILSARTHSDIPK